MKRGVIAVAAALSLVFAVTAFAVEGTQTPAGTATSFEQMKANHLKMLDSRINSLQEEKACAQAATNQDDLKACRSKHMGDMKKHRKGKGPGGPGGPSGQVPPEIK